VVGIVQRILAPNASPMTLEGTNSYLVFGGDGLAIAIDPGPPDEMHCDAIVAAARLRGATIGAIAVTHGHPDHAPGAAILHEKTNAPVYAHALATFPHDRVVGEGDRIVAGDVELGAIDAPGHARDHLVFALPDDAGLFTGDVVIGRGTVVIAPPNGDMRAYQATLHKLRDGYGHVATIYGGHGEAIEDVREKFDEYIAHREKREDQILAELRGGERTIPELVASIYRDVSPVLWPAAARQIFAYLLALEREERVRARTLSRPPSEAESDILNPDLSRIVDPESAAIAAAELGFDRRVDALDAYVLA
jgi:glyoxylase-like metal-dependent hydrolase (beta-lactamase superfamily II)